MKENKVYLNTAEEILDALQKGEAVYEDITGGNIKYKMYNGVMVSEYSPKGSKFINSGTIFVENNRYYVYEKEPIKLEVGKFYKTRDGKKAICAYKTKSAKDDRPYFFSSVGGDEIFSMWTTRNGFCKDEERTYNEDIVDYWED